MNLTYITQLPQIETSAFRELQWSVTWWAQCYVESAEQTEIAWKMYDDSIENGEPYAQTDALYQIAVMFEGNRTIAWHNWQNAKRDYLALMN